jgi:tRNA dimethylallyltransferase
VAREEINKVLFIVGPTAVGKSKLAIELAKKLNGEIISADSMQVYIGMDIGTAKPAREELEEVPHHLINLIAPDKSWSVSDFVNNAKTLIEDICGKGKLPIVVGGTGLYLNALIEGYSFPEIKKDVQVRLKLEHEAKVFGSLHLYERLKKIDPDTAANIHYNDTKRIIRALEVYELTGHPMSLLRTKDAESLEFKPVIIGLELDRHELYKRIEARIDEMLSKGLVDEVSGLIKEGYDPKLTSMQAIGYKEVAEHLHGKYTYDELVNILKQNTRNFAKRQLTWFRRFKNVNWFDVEKLKLGDIIDLIQKS